MKTDIKQLIKEKKENLFLKNIKENFSNIRGISLLNIYNNSDIYKNFVEMLNDILKIGFPVYITKERGFKNSEYIECLYRHLKLQNDHFNWLIPYFDSSTWWMEFEIEQLDVFFNTYYPGNKLIDFTAFDLKNKLLFDIENGESNIEYRIMWFK